MTTFYDHWLGLWEAAEAERAEARKVIHEHELQWVETPQDTRTALLIAPETGFRTWGSVMQISEIPPGHHTGAHKHGEEVLHIIAGTGFSIIDDVRYNWRPGSTLAVPFGIPHQHFNTGEVDARYLSTMAVHLEHLCGVHRLLQLEEKGRTATLPDAPAAATPFDDRGRRVVLHIEDAPDMVKKSNRKKGKEIEVDLSNLDEDRPVVLGTVENMQKIIGRHKAKVHEFMHIGRDTNGFEVHEQEIMGILVDAPNAAGGIHAHMEAAIYVLEGEGYSMIDGERYPWKAGSAIHVQGPQTVHQHVNESDKPSRMLRTAPGVRYLIEKSAKDEFPYLFYSVKQE